MEDWEIWAEALSRNENCAGFYRELFKLLWSDGKAYNRDIAGPWAGRSTRHWIARLVRQGTRTEIGLPIIQRRKEGRGGKVYYVWDAEFLAWINRTWLTIKKNLR